MTTTTFTAMNASAARSASPFNTSSFADIRAALPDMPARGSQLANVAAVLARLALAAVPFGAVGWMFIAH